MKRTFNNGPIDLPAKRLPLEDLPTRKLPVVDLPTEKLLAVELKKNDVQNKGKPGHLLGKSLFLIAFVGITIFAIVYGRSWAIATSKIQSQAFTELYFEDYLHLPSTITPKQLYVFQFTLHNLEHKNMKYDYEVFVESGQNKVSFDKGTIFVKDNQYTTIQEKFFTKVVLPKSKIVVDLVNKNQFVDFWIQGSE